MSAREQILDLKQRITASVIGQETVVDFLLIALLANGHVLLEGLPGLAKTRTIKTLAANLESDFRRIQFTPDMLPSDITGTEIYTGQGAGGEFHFQPRPIFGNLILADEINRAPAKAQAALLEAMEERQVTAAGKTNPLPKLFYVRAVIHSSVSVTAPFVQAPFTEDIDVCRELLNEAQVNMAGPQTAFGHAIGLAINVFDRSDAPERVLIALTDGNDTSSKVPPIKAAEIAKDKGIVVYTVAVGRPARSR